jgi:hypothetical protein
VGVFVRVAGKRGLMTVRYVSGEGCEWGKLQFFEKFDVKVLQFDFQFVRFPLQSLYLN